MAKKIKDLVQIGFIIKDLGPNQYSYTCISNTNKWLTDNYGIDPILFFEEQAVPCMQPSFARYNICDVSNYYGNLIGTSINSVLNSKSAVCSKRYFYIYDLEYTRNEENKLKFDSIMSDNSIVKFTRNKDYFKKISDDGYVLSDIIVDDFDIDQILSIVKGN